MAFHLMKSDSRCLKSEKPRDSVLGMAQTDLREDIDAVVRELQVDRGT